MDAHVKTISEILLSGDQFLVPFFQRHYSWRKEQWQRLLNDIMNLIEDGSDDKHFLGPLVCTPFRHVPGEASRYQLVDGQQRLVTVTLALAALRDLAGQHGLPDLAAEIYEDYMVHRRRQGLQRLKIVPRPEDRSIYEAVIDARVHNVDRTFGIFLAFSFFRREFKKVIADKPELLRKLVVAATARMSLVTISVVGENPYEIFESLNSTGLP